MTRRAVAVVAVVLVGLWGLEAIRHDDGRIPEGTEIGNLDVGGLPQDVARDAVARHALTVARRGVDISIEGRPGTPIHISGGTLGARPRIAEAFEEADDRGVVNGLLDRFGIHRTRTVPLRFTMPPKQVDAVVDDVRDRAGRPPVPATVVVSGNQLKVRAGRNGVGIDEDALRDQLEELPPSIVLQARPMAAPVSTAQAEQAKAAAQSLRDAPPTIVGPGPTRFTLPADVVTRALRFVPRQGALPVALDPGTLGPPLRAAFPDVEQPRRNATFRITGKKVSVTADKPGLKLDLTTIAAAAVGVPGGDVPLSTAPVQASITTASLRKLGVRDVVGEFTTEYPCCAPRTRNIARAAEILDGTVIAANARFSMNDVVGERTEERGFASAPQIADGKFEDGIGGGTSQVATTLYNAAFFAGLELVAHTPHEVYLSRYPMGREATISWGSPDLVFRNDWPAPIYLRVRTTDTSVTVQMLSRSLGRRVTTSMGSPTGEIPPEIKRTYDPTLAPGTEVVDQSMGGPGFSISYTRKVWRGSTLRRDETWTWNYRPVNALVRYGPEVPATTAPAAPPAPAEPPAPAPPVEPAAPDPQAPSAPTGVPAPG